MTALKVEIISASGVNQFCDGGKPVSWRVTAIFKGNTRLAIYTLLYIFEPGSSSR